MTTINHIVLQGHMGRDPELRRSQDGKPIANFSVATKDRNDTEWHNVVAFGKTAEFVEQYFKKGSKITVFGKIKYRTWEKDGEKKYKTEIVASEVNFAEGKKAGGADTPSASPQEEASPATFDEEIPF